MAKFGFIGDAGRRFDDSVRKRVGGKKESAPNAFQTGTVLNPTLGREISVPELQHGGFKNLGDAQLNPLVESFQQARALFHNQPAREFFPGQTTADLTANQVGANQGVVDAAQQVQNSTVPLTQQALQFGLQGVLDPASNPFVQQTIEAAQQPTVEAFQRGVQGISGAASQAGALGGSRQGVLEANLAKDFGRTLSDQAAGIQNNAFNRGLSTFGQTLALAPQTANIPFNALARQQAVGQQEQNQNQDAINEQIARFNFEQDAPFRELGQFQQFITAPGTFQTSQPGPKKNRFGQIIGGATQGAALGSTFGGPGALIGAGVGGVAGAFG